MISKASLFLLVIAAHAVLGQQTDPQVTNLDSDTKDSIAQFEKSFDKILKSNEQPATDGEEAEKASKAEDPVEKFEEELKELPAATLQTQEDDPDATAADDASSTETETSSTETETSADEDTAVDANSQSADDEEKISTADGESSETDAKEANAEAPKVSANKPDSNKALTAELKRGWGALAGSAGSIPSPPPAGSNYLRVMNYSKTDGKCQVPKNMIVHGDFPETPKPKKKYCFPEAWNMTMDDGSSVLMTVSINCENYCNMEEPAEDEDAPVVTQCTMKFYDPNRNDHECKEQDKIAEKKDIKFNRAITTEGDKESGCIQELDDEEISSHYAMRCYNCCGGAGQLAAAWLVILAAVLSNLYAQ